MRSSLTAAAALGVALGALANPLHGQNTPTPPASAAPDLERGFRHPPDSAKPWVYWFVMDGNLGREGITADLEAMKRVGIGGMIFMEVDVGIPKGPVKFMSPPWRELFTFANQEAARLGLLMTMPASPGWTGSGGPWVKPEQSMQKLVFSQTDAVGPRRFDEALPKPPTVAGFYRDVAVLAFPTPADDPRIPDILEKAVYTRGHYSSESGVKALIPVPATYPPPAAGGRIAPDSIVDLTAQLDAQGRLTWEVPAGPWTVLRFGHTSTGANTRPAPEPGLGLECDKFDTAALDAHFNDFLGKIMSDIGPLTGKSLISLHIDSWEMGPQNWTARFPEEFRTRRGYDILRYLPVFTGRVVGSPEISDRFLWDLRQTILELIAENHAGHLAALAQRHGMTLSIEPYDGTPCDDMTYGARADVPMGEFWRDTFTTWFSCTQATSIGHTLGKNIIQAEAFTSGDGERWLAHPGSLKTLGDWALCEGINRMVFHRYAHQPWMDRRPGMTMGPYGIHYERTQTWWEHSKAWVEYLTRSQYLLQQGQFVADVCFLKPEASPQVFRPPASATRSDPPERTGYNFDGCNAETVLAGMSVNDGRLVLPGGMSYRVLVLPDVPTMTPALLRKIGALVNDGATVIGPRPLRAPGLSGYPACDDEVTKLADQIWGDCDGKAVREHAYGKGRVLWERAAGPDPTPPTDPLEKSKWIWYPEGNPAAAAPVGKRYFRRVFSLDDPAQVESATLALTADNDFEVWINGRLAGAGDNFHRLYTIDAAPFLKPGLNVLAIAAVNTGDHPNPAGLIGTLTIKSRGGGLLRVGTDRGWQASVREAGDWAGPTVPAQFWSEVMELGVVGSAPWGPVGTPPREPDAYADFKVVTDALGRMGVPPDFESAGPFRAIHRRTAGADIYFVSSRDTSWASADCFFRVSGTAPELWDPTSGRITRPAAYREKDGRTVVPLWLEPAGSVFVIFPDKAVSPAAGARPDPITAVSRDGQGILPGPGGTLTEAPAIELFREGQNRVAVLAHRDGRYEFTTAAGKTAAVELAGLPAPLQIDGPWEVRFQAGCGAPDKLALEHLADLSTHADPGVKYFSGTATYRRSITVPAERLDPNVRVFLDLGKVQVSAQVNLNGRDLGILWKAPFQLDVTDALRAGENTLEVRVANLWTNRLIGDQSLPPDQRVAWSTWNPFTKDSPLQESGLLGPVILRTSRWLSVGF